MCWFWMFEMRFGLYMDFGMMYCYLVVVDVVCVCDVCVRCVCVL